MDFITANWPHLAAYHPAFVALAALIFVVLLQGFITGPLGLAKLESGPGQPVAGDHSMFPFRVMRVFGNSSENLPAFIGALILAVIAGVDATWVNWLAGLHVGFRLLFAVVYYAGLGAVAGGPRTITFALGWLMNAILAGMALYTLVA